MLVFAQAHAQTDPLPSWNDGVAKKAIVAFVQATTDKASPKFVAPEARCATFDQDGTLWGRAADVQPGGEPSEVRSQSGMLAVNVGMKIAGAARRRGGGQR
jgi:hypothetical protein